jgi:hypothetical protein
MKDIETNFVKLTTTKSKGELEKLAKKYPNSSDEVINSFITTEKFHKEFNKNIESRLNTITNVIEFKEWFIYEAMSGDHKFSKQLAKASVCMEFSANNGNITKFIPVTNNGFSSGLTGKPTISPELSSIAAKAKIYTAWKSSGGNPYSTLRVSHNDPNNTLEMGDTLIDVIRKTVNEDKILRLMLNEEVEPLDEFKAIGRAFSRLKGMGKDAINWLKRLVEKIVKAVRGALNKIKKMGKRVFEGLFHFIGLEPEVSQSIPSEIQGFVSL